MTGSIEDPTPRRAARILLVNGEGRVLMFRGLDPGRPGVSYWFTAGGGLDDGESVTAGAVRELAEETGLVVEPAALGEPIWRQITDFPYDGHWYRQEQDFFVVRVGSWDVSIEGFDAQERESIDRLHWWSIEELTTTDEKYYPEELPTLLREILGV